MTQESGPDGIGGLRVGDILDGRYVILEQIGNGEMGIVYLAVHQLINQKVAIKVLRPELVLQPSLLARFDREAAILAGMAHPNVVAIHDSGVMQTGQKFLVMSHVDGATLKSLIERRAIPPLKPLLQLFMQVCDGLAHAHAHGVTHRDLKPSNIMVSQSAGEQLCARILDFGIARIFADVDKQGVEQTALTRTGECFLSPKYMSPEQGLGRTIDQRADVYSLGCIMYEALTGRPPFDDEQPLRLVSRHVKDKPPPMVSSIGGGNIPRDIEQIVMRAMAKDPAGRQQNMNELKADLQSALRGLEKRAVKLPSRGVMIAATIMLLVVSIATAAGDQFTICKNKIALIAESNLFPSVERRIALLNQTVDLLSRAGKAIEAAQMQAQLLSVTEEKYGHVSMQAAMASKKAADLYRVLNDNDGVKRYSKRSVDSLYHLFLNRASLKTPVDGRFVCQEILDAYKRKDFLPLNSPEINYPTIVLNFAEGPDTFTRTSEIIPILTQTVEMFEHDRKQGYLVTFSLRNLANAYRLERRYREAFDTCGRVLRFAESNHRKPSDTTVDMLILGASDAKMLGEIATESRWLKQALDVGSVLGPEVARKTRLIDARVALAESLMAQGLRSEADANYRQACLRCGQTDLTVLEKQQCSELRAAGRLHRPAGR